jgi:hypothetical protein
MLKASSKKSSTNNALLLTKRKIKSSAAKILQYLIEQHQNTPDHCRSLHQKQKIQSKTSKTY